MQVCTLAAPPALVSFPPLITDMLKFSTLIRDPAVEKSVSGDYMSMSLQSKSPNSSSSSSATRP